MLYINKSFTLNVLIEFSLSSKACLVLGQQINLPLASRAVNIYVPVCCVHNMLMDTHGYTPMSDRYSSRHGDICM